MRRVLAPLAALVAALAAVALITAALLRPAPYTVDVGAPGDALALASFHRPEQAGPADFRWGAPGARLLLPATFDGPLALELRLHGAPGATPEASALVIERDGSPVARLAVGPDWRVYRLLLPPDATPEPATLRVEPVDLAIPASFGPGDLRPLGVALDRLEVAAIAGEQPTAPALGRATAVAWAAALAWAAVAALAGWRHPAATALPLIGVGAGLALWAWLAPLGFAWGAPAPPWWALALGTAAVGGLWLARLRPDSPWRNLAGAATSWPLALVGLPAMVMLSGTTAGALTAMLLPGALAAWALFPEERSLAARVFLGICGSLAVAALLMLALHALPGPVPGWLAVLVSAALSFVLMGLAEQGAARDPVPPPEEEAPRDAWGAITVVALAAGAGLRLWLLGSAEFQGDEARAMLLALGAVGGDDGLLLTHTKGPVEALLPAWPLALAGAGAEWVARLPFALASLGVLAGVLALLRAFGQGAGGPRAAAGVAAALLAVDGLAVAFGRIVQYQSVVMLMMAGAFWCCWRFYEGAPGGGRHLAAAVTLLAVGLLAHYDAVMVAPALAWLVLAGGLRRGWRPADWARGLAVPVLLGAALLASFYLPYVLSESFAETLSYLRGRAAQGDAGGPPFNNLPLYYRILAFYSGPHLAPALAVGVLAALAALLARLVRPRPLGLLLAAGLAAAGLAQWLAPGALALPGGASWAGLAFGLPLAGLCAAPGVPAHVRATAIWLTTALCAQAFLIAEPRTHFYTAHVPAVLLAGLAVGCLAPAISRAGGGPAWRGALAGLLPVAAAALIVGGGLYGQLAYLRQLPEYQRAYPWASPPWLARLYGETLPEAGYFGFPHRDGWKAVAELYRRGELHGSYDTNQNRWLVGWYLGGVAAQCKGQPELYLIAEAEPTVYFPPGYHLFAEVTVGPGRALAIYGREEPDGALRSYALEDLAADFDARPVAPLDAGRLLNVKPPDCP